MAEPVAVVREMLAHLITKHQLIGRVCMGCSACPDVEFTNRYEHAEHVVALITTENLVVPRAEIVGTEYGIRGVQGRDDQDVFEAEDRAQALADAVEVQKMQAEQGRPPVAEPVGRPVLSWNPIAMRGDSK